MTTEERLEKPERKIEEMQTEIRTKAFDETMMEEYAQKRIAEVIHMMGIRAGNGMNDRLKKKKRLAATEMSLDEKIDRAARYGVGVLADSGNISYAPFAESMKKKYGARIEPYLSRIYDQSVIMLNDAGTRGAGAENDG